MVKGGLRLKREVAPKKVEKPLGNLVVAHIWVDSSVYHLDEPFSYLIPGNLAHSVAVGSLVSVPFHGRELLGIVIEISKLDSLSGLKSISKCIGNFPLLTSEIISLVAETSHRYAAHPFDLIRSAIPDRVAQVEKRFETQDIRWQPSNGSRNLSYLQLPPAQNRSQLMATKISQLSKDGSVLTILPDSREVAALSKELTNIGIDHVILDSQLSRSDYFENFLKVRLGIAGVIIGTRSAIYAPISNLNSILIYNEGSENFYEQRSPGWNVRDVALLRSHHERVDLYFIGYSPSTEVARLINENWISFKRSRGKVKLFTYAQSHGELLPSRAIAPIKESLQEGPVLFLVPLKGYAQAIRCAKCKTVSRCECGGAHEKKSQSSPITCNHCLKQVSKWICVWCNNEQPSLLSRGIERHQQELGLLFPNVPIHISTRDHPFKEDLLSGIVIATPSMAPSIKDGYSSVVILEGNRFLNQPDMRSSERIREMYFAHAALARSNGRVILIQDEGHSISTALTTWNPSTSINRDLEERANLALPPYVRTARLTLEISEISRLKDALSKAISEGRMPSSTKLLGPIPHGEKSSLILTVPVESGDELIETIHEFMRRRSASKKSLPSLRIDPYSLSL